MSRALTREKKNKSSQTYLAVELSVLHPSLSMADHLFLSLSLSSIISLLFILHLKHHLLPPPPLNHRQWITDS